MNDEQMSDRARMDQAVARYDSAMHAMQTAVALEMNLPDTRSATEPKHLRVGVNSAHVTQAALVTLLIEKGLFTLVEYAEVQADAMEKEVKRYERLHPGVKFG